MQALREWCADSWQRKAIAVLINTAAFLVSVLAAMLAYTLIFKAPSLGEMVGRLWYTIVPMMAVLSLTFLETTPGKKSGRLGVTVSWISVTVLVVLIAVSVAPGKCTELQKLIWVGACLVAALIYAILDKLTEMIFRNNI